MKKLAAVIVLVAAVCMAQSVSWGAEAESATWESATESATGESATWESATWESATWEAFGSFEVVYE